MGNGRSRVVVIHLAGSPPNSETTLDVYRAVNRVRRSPTDSRSSHVELFRSERSHTEARRGMVTDEAGGVAAARCTNP